MPVFPARTTKPLPSAVPPSSCVSALSPVLISSAAASSPAAALASSSARGDSPSVDAAILPWSSNTTAAWICEEISVRSASACLASIVAKHRGGRSRRRPEEAVAARALRPLARYCARHASSETGSGAEVLQRPRPAPRRDDRLLRASLLRSADLPLPRPPWPDRPRGRVLV